MTNSDFVEEFLHGLAFLTCLNIGIIPLQLQQFWSFEDEGVFTADIRDDILVLPFPPTV